MNPKFQTVKALPCDRRSQAYTPPGRARGRETTRGPGGYESTDAFTVPL